MSGFKKASEITGSVHFNKEKMLQKLENTSRKN